MPNVFAVPGMQIVHSPRIDEKSIEITDDRTDMENSIFHMLPGMLGVQHHRLRAARLPETNTGP